MEKKVHFEYDRKTECFKVWRNDSIGGFHFVEPDILTEVLVDAQDEGYALVCYLPIL